MHVTWYHELRDSWVAWVRRLRAQLYVGYMRYVSPKRSLGLTFNVGNKEAVAQATLLKKRLCHSCFPVNFAKFRKTPFFTEHLWWLLLKDFCMGEFLLCVGPKILLSVIFFFAWVRMFWYVSNFISSLEKCFQSIWFIAIKFNQIYFQSFLKKDQLKICSTE